MNDADMSPSQALREGLQYARPHRGRIFERRGRAAPLCACAMGMMLLGAKVYDPSYFPGLTSAREWEAFKVRFPEMLQRPHGGGWRARSSTCSGTVSTRSKATRISWSRIAWLS